LLTAQLSNASAHNPLLVAATTLVLALAALLACLFPALEGRFCETPS
jgi:hypothetical protein